MKSSFNIDRAFAASQLLLLAGALAGVCLCAALSGCARGDAAANAPAAAGEGAYRVTADTTPFYRYGPQQPNGPDSTLKKGARLAMLQRRYGYSQIRTLDGQVGYVGTEDVAPISPEELAAERAAVLAAQNPVPVGGGYTIPAEAGRQERLPEPEARPTPDASLFRY